MKKHILLIFFFLTPALLLSADVNEKADILSIYSSSMVLDEWKTPGLYSPVNMFDGDIKTCYATDGSVDRPSETSFLISFKQPVMIDEIRIMNGFAKNDYLYKNNSRIRMLQICICTPEISNDPCSSVALKKILSDTKEMQSIKLDREYNTAGIELNVPFSADKSELFYKGEKFNDTCITEIEFYYKSKKIGIRDVNGLKMRYVKEINDRIINAFSDREYSIMDGTGTMYTYKDNKITYLQSYSVPPSMSEVMPERWKAENSRLYMWIDNKWILYKYKISWGGVQLMTNPYEFLSKDFHYTYRLYYKQLPSDYIFYMDHKIKDGNN